MSGDRPTRQQVDTALVVADKGVVGLVDTQRLAAEVRALRDELALQDRPGRPAFRGGHCPNEQCPCARPGLPCDDYAGTEDTYGWCACCGWNEPAHAWSTAPLAAPDEPSECGGCQSPLCPTHGRLR